MSIIAKLRRCCWERSRSHKKVQTETLPPKTLEEEKAELLDVIGRSSTLTFEDKQYLIDLVNRT